MLGLPAPEPAPVRWQVLSDQRYQGVRLRALTVGARGIPALCLSPLDQTATRAGAGVLYCHAHGNAYAIGKSELTDGRPALCDPPLGLALAQAGATVICPDLSGFGARQGEGREEALAKAALWHGGSLMGQMAGDLIATLEVLRALGATDRIATVGISMGGTLAYLVAALRGDVTACAQLCVFANIGPLIDSGAHDLHGPYMTIPGLLPDHDMGDIAALVAPRPQFVMTGARDPLTPDAAYRPAADRLRRAYARDPAALTLRREAEIGHHETHASRAAVMGFLRAALAL
ncbi:MAG: dienelactone hydrolase family protein [Marinibacterium sp.]|nr:dienelactone hydrolase family protein [Marinibacterium sp.]